MDQRFVAISLEDFRIIVSEVLESKLKSLLPPEQDRYLTPTETAKLLKISKVTLISYNKKGWINNLRIGKKVLYKQKDVESALKSIKRYSRKAA